MQSPFHLHRLLRSALTGLILLLMLSLRQHGTTAAPAATSTAASHSGRPATSTAASHASRAAGPAHPPSVHRGVAAGSPSDSPSAPANHTSAAIDVIVIGDSTAANYSNYPYTYPLAGWAMFLQDHLSPAAAVVRDLAVPGCSSMSYYRGGFWQQAKVDYLSAGDYVLIQFGHNDQRPDPLRHTDPFTTYKYYLSIYVNDTRAAQANPVLVTSISRGLWHSNGVFMAETFGNYTVAVRQLAAELHVPLIDLNEDTAELFTRLGEETTQNTLFMCLPAGKYPNYPNGSHDTTHLQVEGAKAVAALAADGIAKADLPLQTYLLKPRLLMQRRQSLRTK